MKIAMRDKKGIALILAIGVVAVVAIIATSFALNMRLEYKAAINYYNGIKANYLAEAAIERAIYELKTHVQTSAFDDLTEDWADSPAYQDDIDGDTVYETTSEILDEQRKVNVNTANQTLLVNLFEELSMSSADASTVWNKINTHRPYIIIQELLSKKTTTVDPLTESEYNTIKDDVTVTSYVDKTPPPIIIGANTGRAPINVNTCSDKVLRAVLADLSDGTTNVSTTTVNSVVTAIQNAIPIITWADFDLAVDGSASAAEAEVIKDNCNPNRTSPVTYTTEFCFNSGGHYEIEGTGTIGPPSQEIATRKITAIVRIYDIYTQTTKDDFRDEDLNSNNSYDASLVESGGMTIPGGYYRNYYDYNEDGDTNDTVDEDLNGNGIFEDLVHVGSSDYNRVTWLDSCPVESTDLFGIYSVPSTFPDSVRRIRGSIKLGYWDDFELRTMVYTRSQFQVLSGSFVFSDKAVGGLPDMELWSMWPSDYGKFALYGNRWTFGDFSLRVFEYDVTSGGGPKDQAYILFRGINPLNPALLLSGSGNLWWGEWDNKVYAWQVNKLVDEEDPSKGRLMDDPIQVHNAAGQTVDKIYYANFDTATKPPPDGSWDPPLNQVYPYPGVLRLWPNSNLSEIGNWNAESDADSQPVEYYAPHALSGTDDRDSKTFNLLVQGSTVNAYVYTSDTDSGGYLTNSFYPVNIVNTTGRIALYGHALYPCWDDLRIIPDSGTYTSKNLRPQDIDSDVTYDVNWCTIAATVTIPTTADPTSETVTLETKSNNDTNWESLSGNEEIPPQTSDGASIQYKATLSTNDADLSETPVLEDIVITYLPRTKMESYTQSP